MHDLKWIRQNPKEFDNGMLRRGLQPQSNEILNLDKSKRDIVSRLQELQQERNETSKEIGKKKSSGINADELVSRVAEIKSIISNLEADQHKISKQIETLLLNLPNILDDSVPLGEEKDNEIIKIKGQPREFSFNVKDHVAIGENLKLLDFDQAAKMSGARFNLIFGDLAKLNRALIQFMLDTHTSKNGYTEVIPPLLVKDNALIGTGQLPKFSDDLYKTQDNLWLIPTSEVSLANCFSDTILDKSDLPIRLTAYTPCFRREAGAAGKDTRGIIRQHQFDKVELVSFVEPDQSLIELERMVGCAELILDQLELPYRIMKLSSGDTGFGASLTYDLEVWLPGQDQYREISSCSNCRGFQALRMGARYKPDSGTKGTEFLHTLNGSGLAVGRTLVSILENYQQNDGSILIPDVLQSYMGAEQIVPKR